MLAAVRLKGGIKARREIEDTLQILGLKKKFSAVMLEDSHEKRGMLMKAKDFITWGEVPEGLAKELGKRKALKPPKGGFRSLKQMYPKGDLGYRGEAIGELLKRMM